MNDKEKYFKKEITSDPKYPEIIEKLERVFRSHGYYPRDFFDNKVWFLREDQTFNSVLRTSEPNNSTSIINTPITNNKICEILAQLNENMENQKDFTKLKIKVELFIYKICETLIEVSKIINRTEDTIKQYNAHYKINAIKENLKILNDRIQKQNKEKYISKLKVSVARMDNFPSGEYAFELKIIEFLYNENKINSMINNKSLRLNETIEVKTENDVINFKTIKSSEYKFENYEFSVFENKNLEDLFKHHSYSGSTFSNFKLKCLRKNKEEIFESKVEYFLDILLIYVEDLYDISKDSFTKNLHIKLKNNNNNNECVIVLEFTLELDDITRCELLKRVNEIFKGVVETKRYNEDLIDEILDSYFSEVGEPVKNMLFKKNEEKRDSCCTGCYIC